MKQKNWSFEKIKIYKHLVRPIREKRGKVQNIIIMNE